MVLGLIDLLDPLSADETDQLEQAAPKGPNEVS